MDLAVFGVKIFDTEDRFDDGQISAATEIIKQGLTGNLTIASLQSVLGFGN